MASKSWVLFNESSKAREHRERFVAENGGSFQYLSKSKGWHWVGEVAAPAPKKSKTTKAKKAK